ncbi:MAG: metal ABC transporter permease [Epsilonproteobacteria bacterium]|nr:metal ABC transporter permease [Campylobacterota bacterium]
MFELMQNAFFASFLLSISIGIIGSLMLINRSHFIAASIAHGSYGGIGIAIYFGFSILLSTTLFALFLALLLAFITYQYKERSDTLIGVIWAVGMSIGIIFTDLTPGYHVDLMSFLFGDILMVADSDIHFMMGVDILLILSIILLYHRFLAISYDRDFALIQGLRVKLIYTFLMILMALTVVMSIRSVGLILVIALFSIPPFVAEKFTIDLKNMILLSMVLAFSFCLGGLALSYQFDLSATPSIIIVAATFFFGSLFYKGRS